MRRKELLRQVADSTIKRFTTIAATVGSSPVPIGDIFILTPLQTLLVAFIAGLSCRKFSLESTTEFTLASGVNTGVAFGVREVARQVVKLLPTYGSVISGAIAGSTNYSIGKAAEAYYFLQETPEPEKYI